MRHAIDFDKDVIEDGYKQIDKENVRDQEINAHDQGWDPMPHPALLEAGEAARGRHLLSEYLSVQHEVWLEEHLQLLVKLMW